MPAHSTAISHAVALPLIQLPRRRCLQIVNQGGAAIIRCPVCSMPFHHTPSSIPSTASTSVGCPISAASPRDHAPSSRGSPPPYAVQAPRSSGSLLPLHPHVAFLPPAEPMSLRSISTLCDDDSPAVLSAAAVAELFPREPWLQRRLHLPVSTEELLPALRGDPVAKAAWMQIVARYRLPQSMLAHRLQVEGSSHPRASGRSSRRGAPSHTPHAQNPAAATVPRHACYVLCALGHMHARSTQHGVCACVP